MVNWAVEARGSGSKQKVLVYDMDCFQALFSNLNISHLSYCLIKIDDVITRVK